MKQDGANVSKNFNHSTCEIRINMKRQMSNYNIKLD